MVEVLGGLTGSEAVILVGQDDVGGWRGSQRDGAKCSRQMRKQITKIMIKSKIKNSGPILIRSLTFNPNPLGLEPNQRTPIHEIDLPTAPAPRRRAKSRRADRPQSGSAEAKANHQSAVAQFFPWLSPGVTYRQHDDKLQDVQGNIIDVHKYSYAPERGRRCATRPGRRDLQIARRETTRQSR